MLNPGAKARSKAKRARSMYSEAWERSEQGTKEKDEARLAGREDRRDERRKGRRERKERRGGGGRRTRGKELTSLLSVDFSHLKDGIRVVREDLKQSEQLIRIWRSLEGRDEGNEKRVRRELPKRVFSAIFLPSPPTQFAHQFTHHDSPQLPETASPPPSILPHAQKSTISLLPRSPPSTLSTPSSLSSPSPPPRSTPSSPDLGTYSEEASWLGVWRDGF